MLQQYLRKDTQENESESEPAAEQILMKKESGPPNRGMPGFFVFMLFLFENLSQIVIEHLEPFEQSREGAEQLVLRL